MKYLVPLLFLIGCAHVSPSAPLQVSNFSETVTCAANSCTRAAPTSTAEGMSLYTVSSFRLEVCAASGQTLSGTGTVQIYWCNSVTGLCDRNPGLDVSVTATTRCQAFPDFLVTARLAFDSTVVAAPNGVGVSGGNLTVAMYPYAAFQM